ncbi:MAG: hypothetical protein LBE09_06800 [Christensenellaceae bacterium]|jgi:hypothetical protein|nr:hypothetical protein [Christensenellaceae bacterium]
MMSDNLSPNDILLGFVSGKITAQTFHDMVCSDRSLQIYLDQKSNLIARLIKKDDNDDPSLVNLLKSFNPSILAERFEIFYTITQLLNAEGVKYEYCKSYATEFFVVIDCMPYYVFDPDYVTNKILPTIPEQYSTKKKIKQARKIMKKEFKCKSKKPDWLQSPEWPYDSYGAPLYFLHQTKPIKDGRCYKSKFVFLNKKTGEEVIVEQFD